MASEVLCRSVSRRILLSNAINSYREWAYLIQEEISNLSSTRVRLGLLLIYINDIAFGPHAEVKKCTSLVGQWQLKQCIAKARASRSSLHRNILTLRHRSSASKHIFFISLLSLRGRTRNNYIYMNLFRSRFRSSIALYERPIFIFPVPFCSINMKRTLWLKQ